MEKNQLHEDNKDIKMLKKETQLVTQQQIPLVHHIIPDENPKFKYVCKVYVFINFQNYD